MAEQKRSPELLALEEKYRELLKKQPVKATEPSAPGSVSLAQAVEHYEPSA